MVPSTTRWAWIGLVALGALGQAPRNPVDAGDGPAAPAGARAEPAALAWPNVSELDPWAFREVVGWAHEAVKTVYRPMSKEQEEALDRAWAPAYGYACPAFVEYVRKLVPLLRDYLAARGDASILAPEFDAAWREALSYRVIEDAQGTEEALAVAWAKKQQLVHGIGRMGEAAERVKALGDPPDVSGCRAKRRALHDRSVKAAHAPRPAWVLTGYDVQFTKEPYIGTFLAGCSRPDCAYQWTDTWSWEHERKGSSLRSRLALSWKQGWWKTEYTTSGRTITTPMTATGWANSHLGLVWEQVPRLVRHVPDRQVPTATRVPFRFRLEDVDRAEDRPFEQFHGRKETPLGERSVEHGFGARLVAPDGTAFGISGGYDEAPGGNLLLLTQSPRIPAAVHVFFRFDAPWWAQDYQRAAGHPAPDAWRGRPAGQGWKVVAVLTVEHAMGGNAPMPGRSESAYLAARNAAEMRVAFEWTFDPSGSTVTPLDLSGEEDLYAATTQVLEPWEEARAAEDAAARKEAIRFHQANVSLAERDRDAWRAQLQAERDPDRREELLRRAMNAEHVRYCELDRIRELETGRFVHTRTPVDEWSSARFVQEVATRTDPASEIRRYAERIQRVSRLAPGSDRDRLTAWAHRQMASAETFGDVGKMREVARVVGEEVQGHWEGVSATEVEKSYVAEQNLRYAQVAKTWAEASMFVATAGASSWAMPVFEGAVGFAGSEKAGLGGRLQDGLVSGLMWTNAAGMAAAQAMEGYEKGGFVTGEKGFAGAAERAAATFAAVKGFEWTLGRIFGAPPVAAGAKPDVKMAFEQAKFRQAMDDGRALVTDYERAYTEYSRALEHGAGGGEVRAMEKALRDKVTAIHSTYESKLFLRQTAREGRNPRLLADYEQRLAEVHRETESGFRRLMSERGYEGTQDWAMAEFRNASSAGTVGMDYDIGLLRRFVDGGAREGRALLEIPFTKGGLRVSPGQLQAEASRAWEAAYRATTGRSARRSFETLTTSTHPEAYGDLAWLGNEQLRHVNIGELRAAQAGQAGDVTLFKGMEALHNPDLGAVAGTIEASRGMAKDIRTKLLPLIEQAGSLQPARAAAFRQYRDHWQQMAVALEGAPACPSRASEQVRLLTGGRELPEVLLDLRDMIATYGRALGK